MTGRADYLASLAELTLLTYLTSFLGLVLAAGFDLTELGSLRAAAVAALPAALSVVYGVAMRRVGVLNAALISGPQKGAHARKATAE